MRTIGGYICFYGGIKRLLTILAGIAEVNSTWYGNTRERLNRVWLCIKSRLCPKAEHKNYCQKHFGSRTLRSGHIRLGDRVGVARSFIPT
jgi:hypothetical protein